MDRRERDAIYGELLTALEFTLDSCAAADREARLPQIDTCCRQAAAHAAKLLRTRRAAGA